MNNSHSNDEEMLILDIIMYLWGYWVIINRGFELAVSATKYFDDSHQIYHLHNNKRNKIDIVRNFR
jgi:hypothetical protein